MNDEKYKGNEGQESPLVRQAREAIQQAATSVKEGIASMNDEVAEEIRGFDWLKKDSSGITIPVRVIKQDRLREIVGEICGVYVDVVGQTYGPGGKDAIIQFPNGVFTTKDGWTVAKNLSLGLDADLNALGRMILDVAANVNLKVGDCTTTAILAASYLTVQVMDYLENHNELPMFVTKRLLVEAINLICDELMETATPINTEGRSLKEIAEDIYKIAYVSTNWNEDYAKMIAEIYEKTGNPYIRVENSGYDGTYVEYVHGYDLKGGIMLRDYYINDIPNGTFVAEKPMIMMFDYDIPSQMFVSLACIGDVVASKNRTFVVMAPGFQTDFIKALHDNNMRRTQTRSNLGVVNLVPVKVETKHPSERSMYDDLRIIVDGTTINKDNQEISSMFDALRNAMMEKPPEKKPDMANDVHQALVAKFFEERKQVIEEAYEYLEGCCGSCDQITVSDKMVLVDVAGADQKPAILERSDRLKAELDRTIKQCDSLSMIVRDVSDYRTRISKLSCNSGVIKVGGYGDADLQACKDSLDDAISACRSAYDFGYVVGGNYAIPASIDSIRSQLVADQRIEEVENRHYPYSDSDIQTILDILDMVYDTALACIYKVAENLYDSDPMYLVVPDGKGNDIRFTDKIFECIDTGVAYDLLENRENEDLIEPVIAPMEVLKGSLRLVKLIASSSQYLYKNFTTEELIGAKDV